jgi:two-component system response regulator MprA/two-component system response regulator TrcR
MIRKGTRVLVVEDDPAIARLLHLELADRGAEVRVEHDGLAALTGLETFRPHVVLLDILLPGMDGEHLLARIRRSGADLPVIMLTARDASADKVRNLNIGADDYLTKPFDIEELVARVGAVLRRIQPPETLQRGDLVIEPDSHRCLLGGEELPLTAREFDLLLMLARHPGQVLSRARLLDLVWPGADVDPNIVDVYLGYLRRKLGNRDGAPSIQTVRGVGFRLVTG